MLRRGVALALALLLTACGGGDGPSDPSPTPGTIAVALNSNAGSVVQGGNLAVALTVTRGGGFTGAVALEATGAPAGVTVAFSTTSLGAGATAATFTFSATTAAAAGTYPITVRATGTGVTAATATYTLTVTEPAPVPSLTLASTTTAVTVTQAQQSAPIVVLLTRGGGATGAVVMSLAGAPAGVTASFTPNPSNTASTQLVLDVGATVAPGTYPITVQGALGTVTGNLPLSLTVTAAAAGDFVMAMVPAAVTVTAGQTALSTVNIARTGGFTGVVNLTVSGLPAGANANFVPAAAAGGQSQLGIVTAAGTPAGTYTLTVRGNATLLAERTVQLTLVVEAASGGSGTVTWPFCDATRAPLWFAYQENVGGPWTRVLAGVNQTFTFTLNSARGGVAYVQPDEDGNNEVIIFLGTRTELQAFGQSECETNPARRTVSGTVAGLTAGQSANIAIGGDLATVSFPGTGFMSTTGRQGVVDVLAARTTPDLATFSSVVDRLILRRGLNPGNNAMLPVLDFDAAESFAPATAQYTFANTDAGLLSVNTGFVTSNGDVGAFSVGLPGAGGATRTLRGVPASRTVAGDLHQVMATAATSTEVRTIIQYNRELVDRTLTFGPSLSAPVVTVASTSPYPRLQARGPWQPEYNLGVGVSFIQESIGRTWFVNATRDYFGANAEYAIELPDLSGVSGFNLTWALAPGTSTQWAVLGTAVVNAPVGPAVENFRLNTAARIGVVAP